MEKKQPYVLRRKLTIRECVEIDEIKKLISETYKKYDETVLELSGVSFRDKKYDHLISGMNELALKIDTLKQKITHIVKTGMRNGLSLDTGYINYSK